jgi:hypothetical protein
MGQAVKLFIRKLHCEKTTEAGEDEVYLIVAGRDAKGNAFQERLPSDNGHWNLNDGNHDNRSVDNITLWSGSLEDGEAVNLGVIGMEEDGGVPDGWMKLSGFMLSQIPEPHVAAAGYFVGLAGTIVGWLNVRDSDDYLGHFSVSVNNKAGTIHAAYTLGDRMQDTGHRYVVFPEYESVPTREFWFTGDGSTYFVYIRTDPVDPDYK